MLFSYISYFLLCIFHNKCYLYDLMLRPHLLCFVYHQGFIKNYFLSNSFFHQGPYIYANHTEERVGGWGLELCHVPVDSIVFTQHICCSILQMEGVFHKIDFLQTSHMYDALLSLTLAVLFSFHIFHQLWNLKFTGGQIAKTLIGLV